MKFRPMQTMYNYNNNFHKANWTVKLGNFKIVKIMNFKKKIKNFKES